MLSKHLSVAMPKHLLSIRFLSIARICGSLTLNHLKISRKARNGFIFCQILIFILHVTYKYCIMYLRWHK